MRLRVLPWTLLALPLPAPAETGLFFMPNRGQAPAPVRYLVRSPELTACFLPAEVVFTLGGTNVAVRFGGANPAAPIEGRRELAGKAHFLLGAGPEQWHTNIPLYEEVLYRGLYPGIDLLYSGVRQRLKSGFVVAPRADPERIRFRYSGGEPARMEADGGLALGSLREGAPEAYQLIAGRRRAVESRFQIFQDGSVGFAVGAYDRSEVLMIDPTISYATYLGGSGLENATAIAVDAAGSAYLTGWTDSANFPTRNPLRGWFGSTDAFIAKLSADGKSLVYCTYLGGSGDDRAYGIAVDSAGNAYVTGSTTSANFPVVNALQSSLAGSRDAFVAKINAAGNALVYSTYFGGRASESGNGIAVDGGGNAYIIGETTSSDLPVRNAYQGSSRGGSEVFVMKLAAAGNSLIFSTYLGGRNDERGRGIAVDREGCAYITGDTNSPDFPTVSAFQATSGGNQDAFVAKLSSTGSSLVYSSYLGGRGGVIGLPESGAGIAVDGSGNAYVTGTTSSADFPLRNARQSTLLGSAIHAFVTKVNASGSGLVYSTFLGGSSIDVATAIAVDASGSAFVAGYTASSDFPSAPTSQMIYSGGYDGFLVQFAADGSALVQSMYLGGSSNDAVNALALGVGSVYLAGQTLSVNFPVKNAVQAVPGGSLEAFVARVALGWYFAIATPCRVADTRGPAGPFGGPSMSAGSTRDFNIPASACGIPTAAMAYALNITVIPQAPLGYLTIWPSGRPRPVVSTLNSLDGRVKANAAIVPAGSEGGVSVYVSNAADVVIDISGYFAPRTGAAALVFYPVTPCRVMDTRNAAGPLGGPALQADETRQIPVSASACGAPASASAYNLNITVIPRTPLGFITVWPSGAAKPGVSTLNAYTGTVTANAAIVPAGVGAAINVYTTNATDLVVDISGYFAAPATGGLTFYAVDPCRAADTRNPPGPLGQPALQGTRDFPLASSACGLPSEAKAYSLNATVVPYSQLGFLTLWPSGTPAPVVSTLNALDGSVVSNAAVVPVSSGVLSAMAPDRTELILDVNGYFAP